MNSETQPDSGQEQLGPASTAAKRQRAEQAADPASERGYPPVADPDDPTGDAVALAATRALVKASSRVEAARVLHTAVRDMGGAVIPARLAGESAMSVDVSLGVGEPRVVVVLDPMDLTSLRLAHHLPALVEDALSAAARADQHQRQSMRATMDPVTGVASRGEIGRRLGLAAPGNVACVVALDGLKELNEALDHEAGEQVLRRFGQLLRAAVPPPEVVGRYGGDEFVVILTTTPVQLALQRAQRLADSLTSGIDDRTWVSIGVAPVGDDGGMAACKAACKALYRAKRRGDRRVELATGDDYPDAGPAGP